MQTQIEIQEREALLLTDQRREGMIPQKDKIGTRAVQPLDEPTLPEGLHAVAIAAIQQDAAEDYAIQPKEGYYEAVNDQHELHASFFTSGVGLASTKEPHAWHWGMQLTGYGYGEKREPLVEAVLVAQGNRMEYQRDTLIEWYLNGPLGLEQGFTLATPPDERQPNEPLILDLEFQGGWTLEIANDRQSLILKQTDGAKILHYGHLYVQDATKRFLPVHLEVISSDPLLPQCVHIAVDDHEAIYPITIDPLIQQVKLSISDTQAAFGASVALIGNMALIGAPGVTSGQGAVYVFALSGGVWSQQAKLTTSDPANGDNFGSDILWKNDTALISAPGKNNSQGAVYVFVLSGGVWSQQGKLVGNDSVTGDLFGTVLALDGDTVVIGAPSNSSLKGAAYVFVRSSGVWSQQAKLTANDAANSRIFGTAIALAGDTTFVGSPGQSPDNMNGGVYIFTRSGTTWTQQTKLTTSDGATATRFGSAVVLQNTTLLVGAYSGGTTAIYAFVWNGSQWASQAKLIAPDGSAFYGSALTLDGDTVLFGAADTPNGQAAAYIFVRNGTTWTLQAKLLLGDGINAYAADLLALKGDLALVGTKNNTSKGGIYVYARTGSVWTQTSTLVPIDLTNGVLNARAKAMVFDGTTVLIGNMDLGTFHDGAAYVFSPILPPPSPNTGAPHVTLSWAGEVHQNGSLALRTGEKVETATDLAVYTMVGGLDFTRTYRQNKRSTFQFMGLGWQHNHAATLTKPPGSPNITIQMPNGGELKLTETAAGSNQYTADNGSDAAVTYNAGTTQYTLTGSDKSQFIFDVTGKLIQRIWPPFGVNAANWVYTYDGSGRLSSVEDKLDSTTLSGRKLIFAYVNNPGQYNDGKLWRVGDQDTTNLGGTGGGSFPGNGVLDTFNRADSASLGASWGSYFGYPNLDVNANQCRNPAADGTTAYAGNYYNAAQYGPDCEAYLTIANRPSNRFLVALRVGGALSSPNNYGFECNAGATGTHRLVRTDGGVVTALGATFTQTLAVGDSIGISAVGSTISAYYKPSGGSWTLLATRTDSTYSAAGYLAVEAKTGGWKADDFGGGTVVGGSPSGRYVEFTYTPQKSNGVPVASPNALLNTVRDARGNVWTYKHYGQAGGETNTNQLDLLLEIVSPAVDTSGDGTADGTLSLEQLSYTTSGAVITNITKNQGNSAISTAYAFQPGGQNVTTETVVGKVGTHYFNNGVYGAFSDPAGNVESQGINVQYRPEIIQDANAQRTQMSWSTDGKFLQKVTDALGNITTFNYNVNDTPDYTLDAEGRKTQYVYGDANNPLLPTAIKFLDTNGTTVLRWQTFSYDNKGRVLTAKLLDPANGTTVMQETDKAYYAVAGNGFGLLQTETLVDPITPANNSTTTFTYDSKGRVIKTQKTSLFGCCQFTYTVYDDNDHVVATINSDTSQTPPTSKAAAIALYDAAHPDKNRVTTYDYDTLGRRVLTTIFDGASYAVKELTAYDALGRVIRSIRNYVSSGGILNPYTASRASFAHGSSVDQNLVTDSFYNARGMLRKQIDPLDNVSLFGYDDAGRLVKTIRNAASVNYNNDYSGVSPDPSLAAYSASPNADLDIITSQTYDKAGNLVKTVDASGVVNYTAYDGLNRPVKTVRAAKDAATITLNVGDIGYVAANDPRSVSYTADPAPDRDLIEIRQYDKLGRVILTQRLLENRPTLEWETTLYGYDGLGRSVKVIKVASNAAYTIAADPTLAAYSASGNADLDLITRTAYDKAERVMYSEDNFGSKSWTGYDGLSRPVKAVVNAVGTASDGSVNDPRSATYVPNAAADKDLVLVTAYNSDGRVQSVTDALGRITRYVYDTVGRVTRTVQNFVDPGQDPSLWVYVNGWKKSDGTTAISNGADNDQNIVSSTVYDGKGRPVQTIDHRNNISLTVYDSLDRPLLTVANYVVQGASQPANWVWSGANNRWENGAGAAIAFGTDNDQNRITSLTYDLLGRSLRLRDAAGTETRYTLDLLGRRTQTIASYVDGVFSGALPDEDLISSTVFNKTGQMIATTDVRGTQTALTYDKLYRPLTLTRAVGTPLSSLTYTCYDKAGRVQRTIQNWSNSGSPDAKDANGNWTFVPASNGTNNDTDLTLDSRFDKASRPLKRIVNYRAQGITNPSNWVWSTANSRWEDGAGVALTFGANTDQNLINLTSYYKDGQVESMTDAEGVVSKLRYDLLRRQTRQVQGWVDQVEDPALWIWDAVDLRWEKSTGNIAIVHGTNNDQNIIQVMTYDKGSRLLNQRDPRGNLTNYVYDQLNRRKSLTNPLTKVWSTVYADLPNAGVRTTTTYPGITGAANYTVQQDMDRLGRPLSIQYGDPAVTPDVKLGYDAAGNRSKLSEYSAANFTSRIRETTFGYDKVHRMSSAGFDNDGNGTVDETVSYQYDAAGLRTRLTLPGSLNVNYTYDARGRLLSLTDWDSQATQMGYDLADRHLNTTRANSLQTQCQYDVAGRLRLLKHVKIVAASFPSSALKDDFNRANSASLGASWGSYFGYPNLDVNTNQCRNPAADGVTAYAGNYYNAAQYGPDCEAYLTIANRPSNRFLVALRVGGTLSSPNNYGLECNAGASGTLQLVRTDAGVVTPLGATFTQALAVGDSVGISAVGSTISAYYKPSGGSWTLLATRTDSTYSAAGYLAVEAKTGGWKVDDFGGGTVSPGGGNTYSHFEYSVDKRGNRIQALEVLANIGTAVDTVIAATDKGLALTGTWTTVAAFKESVQTTAVLKLIFLSNLATLTMGKGPDHSKYDLYIDGLFWQNIDGYAAAATQVDIPIPTATLLTEGPHILEVRNSGLHNASSTGFKVRFNQLAVVDKTWSQQNIKYSYDKLARVLEARYCPGLNLTAVDADLQRRYLYTYDRMHNRLTESKAINGGAPTVKTLTYNAANQISSAGYTYDNNGNLTSDGVNTHTWDRANRLLAMGGSTYKYDGGGNRIQQTVGANVSKYLLDLNNSLPTVLAETVGANVTRFVHSLRGLHQLKTAAGVWEHILPDALGSLRVVTDNALAVQESRSYGVYGDLFGTTGTNQTQYGYTGEPTDGNGLVYDRARYMSPALGQFISLDPAETFNRYAYVDGNPVMRTDPSGLMFYADNGGGGSVTPKPPTNPVQNILTGSVLGTVIGGLLGGGTGAAIGAAVGAVVGTVAAVAQATHTPIYVPPAVQTVVNNVVNYVAPQAQTVVSNVVKQVTAVITTANSGGTANKGGGVSLDECSYLKSNPNDYAICRQTVSGNACPPGWYHEGGMSQACYPPYDYDNGQGQSHGQPYPPGTAWQEYWKLITPEQGHQIAYDNRATCLEDTACWAAMTFGPLALLTAPIWGPTAIDLAIGPIGEGIIGKLTLGARAGIYGHIFGTMIYNAFVGNELTQGITPKSMVLNGIAGAATGGFSVPLASSSLAPVWNIFVAHTAYTFVHYGTSDHPLKSQPQGIAFFLTGLANAFGGDLGIAGASFLNSTIGAIQADAEEAKLKP